MVTQKEVQEVVKSMKEIGISQWGTVVEDMLNCKIDLYSDEERRKLGYNMNYPEKCIVGEAHKFREYNCKKCNEFSMRFHRLTNRIDGNTGIPYEESFIIGLDPHKKDTLAILVKDFVQHFRDEHT